MNWFQIQLKKITEKISSMLSRVTGRDRDFGSFGEEEKPESRLPEGNERRSLYTYRRKADVSTPREHPAPKNTTAPGPRDESRRGFSTFGISRVGEQVSKAVKKYRGDKSAASMPVAAKRRVPPPVPPREDETDEETARRRFSPFRKRTKAPNALLGVAFTSLQLMIFVMLLLGIAGVGGVVGVAKAYVDTTPVLNVDKIQDQNLTSFIYDGNGKLLTSYSGMENRLWAPIDQIPEQLQDAVISIEDSRFMSHNGVDVKRIIGTFFSNMDSDSTQGGSTITQQLIKMTLLSTERTYKRKIQEAWLAMQLETQYSKKQILEAYLNTIPLGQSNYGVKAAAKDYFGKSLNQLTLRECAMLAGLTQSPYLYDPRRNTYTRQRMDITNKRTNTVLMRMYELGYIDKTQYEAALKDTVKILPANTTSSMYDMPYFIEYAIDDIITHMLKDRGMENTKENRDKMDSELRTGGYNIYLTVDPQIQKTAEDTLYNYKGYPKMKHSADSYTTQNDANGTYKLPQPQVATAVLDYHSGELKAIVGGRQQPTVKRSLNRAYQQRMPVGSSIKPIAVYGPAIDKGMSPGSVVMNIPAGIKGWGTSKGYPDNYGGGGFTGPISIRNGLAKSLNVVAARVLLDDVTIEDSVGYLQKNGVPTQLKEINKDGPGLALGTSGITPVEMSAAFGTFGNKGEYIEPLSFRKIVDSRGNTVLDANKIRVKTTVFKPSTAWMMVDLLENAVRSGTGAGANLKTINTAGKTGTNSDNKGVFFTGFTPYYSCAMWIGSDRYKSLAGSVTGGSNVAPLWKQLMQKVHTEKGLKNKDIIADSPQSLGLVKATVCGVSGLLPTDACKNDPKYGLVTDWYLKGTVPTKRCNLHYDEKICSLSNKLATQYCPPDEVKESSVVLAKNDPILRGLSQSTLLRFFPTAVSDIINVSDLSNLSPDNPDYASYFCPIHTQEWAEINEQFVTLSTQAKLLINDVKAQMKANPALPQSVKNTLNNKITALQAIIDHGTEDPKLPAATAYQQLQTAYQDLQNYASTALVSVPPSTSPSTKPSVKPTQTTPAETSTTSGAED